MNAMLPHVTRHFASLIASLAAFFCMSSACLAKEEVEVPAIIYTYGREHCEECRSYLLKLFTSGQVVFEGTVLYYELPPSANKSIGREIRETKASAQTIASWINALTSQGFFSLLPRYHGENCAIDDRSEQALTLFVGGQSKTVAWIGCPESQAPLWLRQIANDIRKQVNPDQWLKVVPNPYRKTP